MQQIEYTGKNSINNLHNILAEYKASKVFLVTGKKSFIDCKAQSFINEIKNIDFIQFNDFSANPKIEDVNTGLRSFNQSGADTIIAIGGGSAIDIAKLIKYYAIQNIKNISIADIENKPDINVKNNISLIAIPTTSGSGSEATKFAVMYANKIKYSVDNNFILPGHVIIDPLLSMSLSPYNTAVTGLDALCHAIESYWSINSTEVSKDFAKKAIASIINNLSLTVSNPDIELRLNMAIASNLAGKAINITKTTAAHAMSYTLTAYFSIPHGLAVALLLPDLLVYNYNVTEDDINDSRGVNYLKQNIMEISRFLGGKNILDAKNIIENIIHRTGLSLNLSSYGIKTDDVDFIVDNTNIERLNNNPRKLNKNEIKKNLKNKIMDVSNA